MDQRQCKVANTPSIVLPPGLAFSRKPRLPSDLCLCPALLKYFASIPIRTAGTSWSPKAIAAGHYANVLWEDSTFHRVPRVSSSEQDLDACGNFIIGEPASVWGDCDKGPFQNSC